MGTLAADNFRLIHVNQSENYKNNNTPKRLTYFFGIAVIGIHTYLGI